jgi:hypothetical protein
MGENYVQAHSFSAGARTIVLTLVVVTLLGLLLLLSQQPRTPFAAPPDPVALEQTPSGEQPLATFVATATVVATATFVATASPTPASPVAGGDAPAETPAATGSTSTPGTAEASPAAGITAAAATPVIPATAAGEPAPAGALIALSMDSRVGLLLDDYPPEMRDRVAAGLAAESDEFWRQLAQRQVQLTKRRLDFRNFAYPGKGQLPLPPEAVWQIELDPATAVRETVNGHDLVLRRYTFSAVLLSDEHSPAEAEPALAGTGGVWNEPFVLPLDPTQLLQRTGNACLNEAGYPPDSYDSENAWILFDHTCVPDSTGPLGCHRSIIPRFSCVQTLNNRVGTVETELRFERLPWQADLADAVRIGDITFAGAPDLKALDGDLAINRIIYRYFPANACALQEGCVGAPGWRRLLQFTATVHNIGAEPLDIDLRVAEDPHHNLFKYDACHDHFHFVHYGYFYLENEMTDLASKQAFCVQSTSRFSNNENSPLIHNYSCQAQGIQAGWVDEYIAGLDCQWIDITDAFDEAAVGAGEAQTYTLSFSFNPDEFICEGTLVRDENGNVVFQETGFTTPAGAPIRRPVCEFAPGWADNNVASLEVTIPPHGGLITSACAPGEVSPLRNCGFREEPQPRSCTPGETVRLTCSVEQGAAPQTLRACEWSTALGAGVACAYQDALLNRVITSRSEVIFTCPAARDAQEPGGNYLFYTAPAFPGDAPAMIRCEP